MVGSVDSSGCPARGRWWGWRPTRVSKSAATRGGRNRLGGHAQRQRALAAGGIPARQEIATVIPTIATCDTVAKASKSKNFFIRRTSGQRVRFRVRAFEFRCPTAELRCRDAGNPHPFGDRLYAAVRVQHGAQRTDGVAMWPVVHVHPSTVGLDQSGTTKLSEVVTYSGLRQPQFFRQVATILLARC